jgi:hypothetical protein
MAKDKEKKSSVVNNETNEVVKNAESVVTADKPKTSDLSWTDYVLGLLSDDEKIQGNPTTDGLRRIFEEALNCILISSTSNVTQSPEPGNEKRATVVHSITYLANDQHITIDGAADVYWGNCDKIYRNHPVAVAETRAEGRALRRALKLRKVVAAEELAKEIEDHPDENSVSKISVNQINFIDVIAQRLNVNVHNLIKSLAIDHDNIYNISHDQAISVIQQLTAYQQDTSKLTTDMLGYNPQWK